MPEPRITPRNLSYNSTLPPFLQRLHHTNTTSNLDGRHEFAVARPKRARDVNADEEDEPAYVDERTGEVITKEDYAALVFAEEKPAGEGDSEGTAEGGEKVVEGDSTEGRVKEEKKKEKLAAIGGPRKRKAGKVIGGEESEDEGAGKAVEGKAEGESRPGEMKSASSLGLQKGKKAKGKKIKLSFGDDEG